ncbi:ROK family protein, partial [Acinetobacter baumannii]
ERLAALFTRAGTALGLGIANLCNVLNPARVIVSGAGTRAGSLLLDPLKATMDANLISALQGRIDVLVEPWGDEVWARGAASLVLEGIYRAPW